MRRIELIKAVVLGLAMLGVPLSASAAEGDAMVNGEVTKVDESAGKVTIKHDAIPNLDMGAMTMVFKAGEGVDVKGVKAGDKVMFHAEKVNGQITVTQIEKSK